MNGSQVAYHLRVNKYIDRQMFVEALGLINRFFPIAGHGYVSMAGAYLEDCRVLHRATRIARMYSFDTKATVLARQEVNRPFGFVQTHLRSSEEVVNGFDVVRTDLGGTDTNVIVWLDYAAANQRRSQLQELGTLVSKLTHGDVVRVTLNAHRTTLGTNTEYQNMPQDDNRPDTDDNRPDTLAAWRHAVLKDQLGEYLPADRDDPEHLETKEGFYQTLLRAVKHAVVEALQPRPELMAFPVLSTAYDDNHGMITSTCVIIEATQVESFKEATKWSDEWPHKPGPEWDDFVEIQVPYLSLQERHVLHAELKNDGEFCRVQPTFVSYAELEQYLAHYLRYPTYAPLDVL